MTGTDKTIQILSGVPIREHSVAVDFPEDRGRFRRPGLFEQKARQCELIFRVIRSNGPDGVEILARLAPNQVQGRLQIRCMPCGRRVKLFERPGQVAPSQKKGSELPVCLEIARHQV